MSLTSQLPTELGTGVVSAAHRRPSPGPHPLAGGLIQRLGVAKIDGRRSREGHTTMGLPTSDATNSSTIGSSEMSRSCVAPGYNVSVNGSGSTMPVALVSPPCLASVPAATEVKSDAVWAGPCRSSVTVGGDTRCRSGVVPLQSAPTSPTPPPFAPTAVTRGRTWPATAAPGTAPGSFDVSP